MVLFRFGLSPGGGPPPECVLSLTLRPKKSLFQTKERSVMHLMHQ